MSSAPNDLHHPGSKLNAAGVREANKPEKRLHSPANCKSYRDWRPGERCTAESTHRYSAATGFGRAGSQPPCSFLLPALPRFFPPCFGLLAILLTQSQQRVASAAVALVADDASLDRFYRKTRSCLLCPTTQCQQRMWRRFRQSRRRWPSPIATQLELTDCGSSLRLRSSAT